MGNKRKRATTSLSDNLIIEILRRLPERPLHRFKCVSRSWRDLISGPVHRSRLAVTDAASGFFYHVHANAAACPPITHLGFTALCPPDEEGAVDDPAFPFLPSTYARTNTELLDSCNGLLLFQYRRDHPNQEADPSYVVCNPATKDCHELPLPPAVPEPRREHGVFDLFAPDPIIQPDQQAARIPRRAALGFDPAVSPHFFHVFELVSRDEHRADSPVKIVHIYSSETGKWIARNNEWFGYEIVSSGRHAYLNGFLHFTTADAENGLVASVDTKGQKWKVTRVCPEYPAKLGGNSVIGQSKRRLLFVDAACSGYAPELSIYALEGTLRRRGTVDPEATSQVP
ncbi:hypothetical protein QOZ80_1AG0046740 [Eleusine coracana subsp. coracana]|nr:hypothetical protein QOZ80_1AG0046740 [Eleusine coracana subsp. coracana]